MPPHAVQRPSSRVVEPPTQWIAPHHKAAAAKRLRVCSCCHCVHRRRWVGNCHGTPQLLLRPGQRAANMTRNSILHTTRRALAHCAQQHQHQVSQAAATSFGSGLWVGAPRTACFGSFPGKPCSDAAAARTLRSSFNASWSDLRGAGLHQPPAGTYVAHVSSILPPRLCRQFRHLMDCCCRKLAAVISALLCCFSSSHGQDQSS